MTQNIWVEGELQRDPYRTVGINHACGHRVSYYIDNTVDEVEFRETKTAEYCEPCGEAAYANFA